MLKTLLIGCKQHEIVRKRQTVGPADSNSGTLVDSSVDVNRININCNYYQLTGNLFTTLGVLY